MKWLFLFSLFSLKGVRCSESEPLMYLYRGEALTKYELSDDFLSRRLQLYGYSGIEELDTYYVEYINYNYDTDYNSVYEMEEIYLEKVFPKECSVSVKESNFSLRMTYFFRRVL